MLKRTIQSHSQSRLFEACRELHSLPLLIMASRHIAPCILPFSSKLEGSVWERFTASLHPAFAFAPLRGFKAGLQPADCSFGWSSCFAVFIKMHFYPCKQACGLVMHFDKSVNRNIVLEKIQKNSCNVRGFPIKYQVLWHDSYEARGCYPLW